MVKEQIVIIFNENKKRYGYRRITKELHNNDICVNHKTVQRLMKQLGLVCQVRAKRKYSSYKGEVGEVAPNLLERHFKTNQPNRKWVTDVTEFKVNDQKLYLSPILDLFNGEVVSYNLSRHPNFKQITDMLEGAFQKLPDKVDNLILHSDQGWQYKKPSPPLSWRGRCKAIACTLKMRLNAKSQQRHSTITLMGLSSGIFADAT